MPTAAGAEQGGLGSSTAPVGCVQGGTLDQTDAFRSAIRSARPGCFSPDAAPHIRSNSNMRLLDYWCEKRQPL